MSVNIKPLAALLPVPGMELGVVEAGIKYPERRDLVVMRMAEGSSCAGVFTRNQFCAAPVIVAREHLATMAPRYLVINTGNANAGTGDTGMADAEETCRALAEIAGCDPEAVLPFSTGVIGEPLPMERLLAGLAPAVEQLAADAWQDAAHGIMTTDTQPKGGSRTLSIDGQTVTLTGIAKGAGMICPDMATMLCFIATDAAIAQEDLQMMLGDAVEASFNRITIDGDTSTNDACMLIATGASGVAVPPETAAYEQMAQAVRELCTELAQTIVRDGEGATKFVTIQVEEGLNEVECLEVAYTIAHSPLVKTALFASDPNWGRILAAVGRAGVAGLVIDKVQIYLNDVCIVQDGGRAPDYTETAGQAVMAEPEITIRVLLGRGDCQETVWTTDLSYDYVKINAEYRT